MADKDSLKAKWITVTKDTVTSVKDQEAIAATFFVLYMLLVESLML